jgi:hydroxypyruvate reductase
MLVAGGEPTVTLIGSESGTGGRCQELALAAAQTLRHVPGAVLLLAAGTDGRDGPTTAAGAIVDGHTWDRIGAAGIDVAAALARHDSHRALAAADALLWTGPTGTNVADLVLAVRASDPAPVSSDVPAAQ